LAGIGQYYDSIDEFVRSAGAIARLPCALRGANHFLLPTLVSGAIIVVIDVSQVKGGAA
jgi:hypothetical protein